MIPWNSQHLLQVLQYPRAPRVQQQRCLLVIEINQDLGQERHAFIHRQIQCGNADVLDAVAAIIAGVRKNAVVTVIVTVRKRKHDG